LSASQGVCTTAPCRSARFLRGTLDASELLGVHVADSCSGCGDPAGCRSDSRPRSTQLRSCPGCSTAIRVRHRARADGVGRRGCGARPRRRHTSGQRAGGDFAWSVGRSTVLVAVSSTPGTPAAPIGLSGRSASTDGRFGKWAAPRHHIRWARPLTGHGRSDLSALRTISRRGGRPGSAGSCSSGCGARSSRCR
jgi:hypothetical protein